MSVDPPGIEPGFPVCRTGVFPLDHEPVFSVDRMGIEPITPILQGSVASLGTCQPECLWRLLSPFARATPRGPCSVEGPSGNRTRSPSLPRRCATGTPTDHCFSDPGWNRTSDFLGVIQASSPLDHGIIRVTEVGVEPTKSPRSQRDRFSSLRTWPSSSGSGSRTPAVQAYEARMSTGPPASSCSPRYRTGHTGLMGAG